MYFLCGTPRERTLTSLPWNRHHPTIKFTADTSQKEINFLDTTVFKGERFKKESVLDVCTHFKATETFQYTHFSSCHAPGMTKGFIKFYQIYREKISVPAKRKSAKKHIAFCHAIQPISAELKKNNNEQMASHSAATIAA